MNPAEQQARAVLDAVLDAPPIEREACLDAACAGDVALRVRVEKLLRLCGEADSFFEAAQPAMSSGGAAALAVEKPGDFIGAYRLVEKLGEGGGGVVYLAEQQEPVRRQVALKIIKLGMDTREVIARFEAERQALAVMEHPQIARVFDAGATATGRPFFVMELVRGERITDFCDHHRLSTTERLRLFMQVCHAVQHAHQKGIIHRDLKPSNILVAEEDGGALPKIIDFGIAKATAGSPLTDKTVETQAGLILGTPAYMSPEQAELNASGVDTRTDVYALGVLLYELLTGRTPFDSITLLQCGLDEMRRAIRETVPARPSTRLRTLAAADLREVADRRKAEPPRLIARLRGDLDWIVLKTLEKDRTRRYESASALALDVRRHLDSEPVSARPPALTYVLSKMVRRNRLAVAAGAAVIAALVTGLGLATVMFFKERDARQRADEKAEESRQGLVRFNVSAGNKLVEEGDALLGLLHFAAAWRLDEGDASREEPHRRRCAAILRSAPQLDQVWFHPGTSDGASFGADGGRVLLDGRVWDVRSGAPAGPPLPVKQGGESFFLPDGKRVLAKSADGRVRLLDATTGAEISVTEPDLGDIAPSRDGLWVAAAMSGGVRLFHIGDTITSPLFLPAETTKLLAISAEGNWLATSDGGTAIQMWALPSGTLAQTFTLTASAGALSFSPDGRHLAVTSGRRPNDVSLWSIADGRLIVPPFQPGGDIFDCRFSPDGERFATASWSGYARIWDANSGRPLTEPMTHQAGVHTATFSPRGDLLATASWDNSARVWDAATGSPLSPRLRHGGLVTLAAFSPDATHLLTMGQDEITRLWRLPADGLATEITRDAANPRQVVLSQDGRLLLTYGDDARARVIELSTGKVLHDLAHPSVVWSGAFSPDGSRLLTGCDGGTAHLWDTATGRETAAIPLSGRRTLSVEFSPDGLRGVVASEDGTARVFDIATGRPLGTPMQHEGAMYCARFNPDGTKVLTAGADATTRLWDATTGTALGPPMRHSGGVRSVCFSPDGRHFLTACWERTPQAQVARVWDTATCQPATPPMPHTAGIIHASYSPDGRWIATAGDDNRAIIWEAATGKRAVPPLAHRAYVFTAAFSPDSKFLVTASADHSARVWDVRTGEAVSPPLPHGGPVPTAVWTKDGRRVVTGCDDGRVRSFDLPPSDALPAAFQRHAELLSAHRLEPHGGVVPLTADEMRERWQSRTGR